MNSGSESAPAARGALQTGLARSGSLLGLWVVLIGIDPGDVAVGMVTAGVAAWVSLLFMPPHGRGLRPSAIPRLVLHFLSQSMVSGIDVARRALDPRMPLRPGFAVYRVGFSSGPLRNAFIAETSLLPGTVAVGDDNGRLLYHCLDVDQPVVAQLAAEEALLRQALRGSPP